MEKVWDLIKSAQKINVYTHKGPDGDSLGVCVGLKRMINYHYPSKDIEAIVLDPLAGKLATCEISRDTVTLDREANLYVYPDTPVLKMIGSLHSPSVAIDHHAGRESFSDYEYVKVWPSCCGLLLNEFQNIGLNISSKVAEAFLVGAVTDTGQGTYGDINFRSQALKDIGTLDKICEKYQGNFVNTFLGLTLEQEKWLGKIYQHIKVNNGCMTLEVPAELSQGVNLSEMRMMLQELTHRIVADHYIWGYPYKNTVRYSARSQNKDVNMFATKFGGAGHKGAASFEYSDSKPNEIFKEFERYTSS